MAPTQRYRRLEPVHLFLAVLWLAGCGVAARPHPWMIVAAIAGLGAFYLLGPAAAIGVTPTHVTIDNPYVRHRVPRSAVAGPPVDGFWYQRLPLRDGAGVRLVALSLNLPRGYPDQLGRHDHRSLASMLAKVPPQDDDSAVRSSPRWPNIALAVLVLTTIATPISLLATGRLG